MGRTIKRFLGKPPRYLISEYRLIGNEKGKCMISPGTFVPQKNPQPDPFLSH
jgi:hypothetical protein